MSGVTRDCNCPVPAGHVKAERIAGGFAAGAWGSAREGDVLMLPRHVAEANPEYWLILDDGTGAAQASAAAAEALDGLTVAELTSMAADAGVELPRKARKAQIVEALNAATEEPTIPEHHPADDRVSIDFDRVTFGVAPTEATDPEDAERWGK